MIVFRHKFPKSKIEPSWDRAQIVKALRTARSENEIAPSFKDKNQDDLFRCTDLLWMATRTIKDQQDARDLEIIASQVTALYWEHYH